VIKVLSSPHNHTRFVDGANTAAEMAETAFQAGFVSFGFSEHGPQTFDREYALNAETEAAYRAEVNTLKGAYAGRLKIWLGIERDSYADFGRSAYEYVIGSTHYLPAGEGHIAVDSTPENLDKLIRESYGGDPYRMARDYFERHTDFLTAFRPDIIGHFDLVKKMNQRCGFFDESDRRYTDPALQALERAAETGALLEINTGAIARGWRDDPYPSPLLLKRWRELGGRAIVSADCHNARFIDCSFDLCVEMLLAAGFTQGWRLGTGDDLFEPFPLA
jgi:histidinol-phosphatase (PHP family)